MAPPLILVRTASRARRENVKEQMKDMKQIIILGSAALLLAGCSLYKPYSRPEVEVDNLYGEGVEATDTVSIANLSWTELFTDPLLQGLIREGLENNTDLGIARLRVKEAEATLFSSRLAYLPSLNLAPQGEVSSYDGAEAAKTYNLAVSAGWELDLFGKLTNAARAAFYPSITLSGSAGWTNNSGTAIVNPGNWLLSAISSLTQPLFNRGQNIANLRIAKAQQEEALLSFKQSLLKAGSEVNDALVQ